jgi:hypothetical protein
MHVEIRKEGRQTWEGAGEHDAREEEGVSGREFRAWSATAKSRLPKYASMALLWRRRGAAGQSVRGALGRRPRHPGPQGEGRGDAIQADMGRCSAVRSWSSKAAAAKPVRRGATPSKTAWRMCKHVQGFEVCEGVGEGRTAMGMVASLGEVGGRWTGGPPSSAGEGGGGG